MTKAKIVLNKHGSRYLLWVNGTLLRSYSSYGISRGALDAEFLKQSFLSVGLSVSTDITTEEHERKRRTKKTESKP